MKRYLLFENGDLVYSFISERVARFVFLKKCNSCDFQNDEITLVDLENDGKTIAFY